MSRCQCCGKRHSHHGTTGGGRRAAATVGAVVVAAIMASAANAAGHHHHGRHGQLDSVPSPPSLSQGNHSQRAWARAVLAAGGWPQTGANIGSLIAWATHEDPWNDVPPDGGEYTKNPLNLTYGPGAIGSVPNTPNVSILPNWPVGVRDTAGRISESDYSDVAAALKSGNGLCGQSFGGLSTWSGGGYSSVC